MAGRTGAASRRHRRAIALGASGLVHVALLSAFAILRSAEPNEAEPPVVTVELVRIRPSPRQASTPAPTEPQFGRRTVAPATSTVAPRYVRPEAPPVGLGERGRGGVDLNGPVFADGQWPRPGAALRTRCDPEKDPARLSPACRREDDIARAVTASNDPQNGRGDFAREARHNEALRRYHDLPGGAGDPGVPCAIFHRC